MRIYACHYVAARCYARYVADRSCYAATRFCVQRSAQHVHKRPYACLMIARRRDSNYIRRADIRRRAEMRERLAA